MKYRISWLNKAGETLAESHATTLPEAITRTTYPPQHSMLAEIGITMEDVSIIRIEWSKSGFLVPMVTDVKTVYEVIL